MSLKKKKNSLYGVHHILTSPLQSLLFLPVFRTISENPEQDRQEIVVGYTRFVPTEDQEILSKDKNDSNDTSPSLVVQIIETQICTLFRCYSLKKDQKTKIISFQNVV